MQTLMRLGGAVYGVATGGTVGGFVGWALGDFAGRSNAENNWFLSLTAGASLGLAVAIAFIVRRAGRWGRGSSLLFGTVSGIVAAAAVVLLVAWQRHP